MDDNKHKPVGSPIKFGDGMPSEAASKGQETWPTVYMTAAQAHRMAALACDALVGLEFRTDDSDMTAIVGAFVDYNCKLRCFIIYSDGRYEDET